MLFKYVCKFRTSSEKFEIRTIQISWKIYKILKTVEFFNMWLFISKIKNLDFCICQNTHFCCSGLGQVSSWWINSIFCVGKVSIWRCLLMLTFSGLHFLFYKYTKSLVNTNSFYTNFTNTHFQKVPIPHLTRTMKQKFLH